MVRVGTLRATMITNVVVYLQYGIHNVVVEPRGVKDSPWIGIVHRDTKPANILLRTDYRSKLPHVDQGDFGQAICLDAFDMATGNANTWAGFLDWAPPEAPRHHFHSDTGAIGNVVQAMCRLVTSPPSMGPKRTYWGAGEEYSKRPRSNHRDRPPVAKVCARSRLDGVS